MAVRSRLQWEVFPVGALETNCYLVWCASTKEGILLDPGDESDEPFALAESEGIRISTIITTHGHFDHIAGAEDAKSRTSAGLLLHGADHAIALTPPIEAAFFVGRATHPTHASGKLTEGQIITIGDCALQVMETPGHTPGCVCLHGHGVVFSGDTLFYHSIGRTDLPGGDPDEIVASVTERLFHLPDDTLVLPGHGRSTTIGEERDENPFVL